MQNPSARGRNTNLVNDTEYKFEDTTIASYRMKCGASKNGILPIRGAGFVIVSTNWVEPIVSKDPSINHHVKLELLTCDPAALSHSP